jgi:hypothetical protein
LLGDSSIYGEELVICLVYVDEELTIYAEPQGTKIWSGGKQRPLASNVPATGVVMSYIGHSKPSFGSPHGTSIEHWILGKLESDTASSEPSLPYSRDYPLVHAARTQDWPYFP